MAAESTLNEQLLGAIAKRRRLKFRYNGLPRFGEPHVLGVSRGSVQLLFYQTGGATSSGGLPQWRRFHVDRMSDLNVEDEIFPGGRQPPSGTHAQWDEQWAFVP